MNKKHLTFIIVLSILFIGGVLGIWFIHYQTVKMEGQVTTLKAEVADLEKKSDELSENRQVTNSTEEETRRMNAYFVGPTGALDFVTYIESLASASGLSFKIDVFDVEGNEALEADGKEFLRTAIRTSGSLRNTRNFLQLIETLPFNVKVSRADVRKSSGDATKPTAGDVWAATVDFSAVKIKER